jgi:hypothetical protein
MKAIRCPLNFQELVTLLFRLGAPRKCKLTIERRLTKLGQLHAAISAIDARLNLTAANLGSSLIDGAKETK